MGKEVTIRKYDYFDDVIFTDGVEEMDTGTYQPKLEYPPLYPRTT